MRKSIIEEDPFFVSFEIDNGENKDVKKDLKNGRVKVRMDVDNSCFTVSNSNDPDRLHAKPFRGTQMNGFYDEIFGRRSNLEAKDAILYHYTSLHKNLSPEEKQEVINRIDKNIDLNVFKSLYEYDCATYWESNKSDKYLEVMLKSVRRKSRESDKHFKSKELKTRQRELRLARIEIEYDLERILLSRNHPLDKIKMIRTAIAGSKFATIDLFGKKIISNECTVKKQKPQTKTRHFFRKRSKISERAKAKSQSRTTGKTKTKTRTTTATKKVAKKQPKFEMTNKIKKFKTSKVFTAPKGMFDKLSKKVQEKDFKQKVKKVLVTAGIVGMVGLSGLGISNLKTASNGLAPQNSQTCETSMQYASGYESELSSENVTVTVNETKPEVSVEPEVIKPEEVNKIDSVKVEEVVSNEEQGESVVLQDALMECLGIDMNSSFSMTSGKYYEAPTATGNSGSYEKYGGNVKLSYVVAMESGNYYQYNVNDGLTVSQIKEKHPNAEISYHVVNTDNGMVLGWNSATDNNIERNMVNAALMSVKAYIPTETMKFLCNTDLSSSVNNKECEKHFNNLKKAIEQSRENINVVDNER